MGLSISAIACVLMSAIVLLKGPKNPTTKLFTCLLLLVSFWLWLAKGRSTSPTFPWHRANAAIASFFPLAIWILKESIYQKRLTALRLITSSWPLCIISIILASLSYTDSFIYINSLSLSSERGSTYYLYAIINTITYVFIARKTWDQIQRQNGMRRLETLFLVFSPCLAFCYGG